MILVALLIGVVLVVAALRGTQATLFSALAQDVPAYVTWAAAIVALGAIGYVPGLRPISRGLLALVIIVIVMRNYQAILAGFQAVASGGTAGGSTGAGASAAPAASSGGAASPLAASPGLGSPPAPAAAAPSPSQPPTPTPFGNLMTTQDFNTFGNLVDPGSGFGSQAGVNP